ncbi:MAG: hypothetical protein HYZ53_03900 [Planctomycetes bacterium]|nr:hypothetical protein [Planctomycetota bacterium]
MSAARRVQFSLAGLLATLLCLSVLAAIGAAVRARLQTETYKTHCRNNLRQLGNYLTLYASRTYCGQFYPDTSPPGGSGAPVPAGPNGAFWAWLYRVPNQTHAVSQRPADDGIYVCQVHRYLCHLPVEKGVTTTALDYTAPNFAATWQPGIGGVKGHVFFPYGRLGEPVRGDTPIAGDLIGPTDAPNHGGAPGAPDDDWNMLCFDGHVERVLPESTQHAIYAAATVGVRTT